MSVGMITFLGILAAIFGAAMYAGIKNGNTAETLQDEDPLRRANRTHDQPTPNFSVPPSSDSWVPRPPTAAEMLKDFLDDNGCKPAWEETEEGEWLVVFRYQGGHYFARASKQNQFLGVHYNGFYETEREHLQAMLRLCNTFNNWLRVFKVTCTLDEDTQKLHLNLCFETYSSNIDDLSQVVGVMPRITMDLVRHVTESAEMMVDAPFKDDQNVSWAVGNA